MCFALNAAACEMWVDEAPGRGRPFTTTPESLTHLGPKAQTKKCGLNQSASNTRPHGSAQAANNIGVH